MEENGQQLRNLIGKAAQDPEFYGRAIEAMEGALKEFLTGEGFDLSDEQVSALVRMDHGTIEGALAGLGGADIVAA